MPKKPDKSKMVRIKSAIVEIIEEESLRLNMSFLDTMYFMLMDYHRSHHQSSPLCDSSFPPIPLPHTLPDDDELELNLDDFA